MRAALRALKMHKPARVIVAAPVAAPETVRDLDGDVDEVVCVATPEPFHAVGEWYGDFSETPDGEVLQLLWMSRTHEARV
jgi:putative phosphoribosyl transferase